MLEEFKDNSPIGAKCGLYLSQKSNPSIVRHFGLRLVDSYIKIHWNEIEVSEKFFIKDSILNIIEKCHKKPLLQLQNENEISKDEDDGIITAQSNDIQSVLEDELHIKDAISRIVVEIIKREWPQQWPTLFQELNDLCLKGDAQVELVLLIFLRLAEDVMQFQNVPDKRRREIHKSLSSSFNEMFAFFWKTLSEKCEKYFLNKQVGAETEALIQCRVAKVTLETICLFLEWVPIDLIFENKSMLKLLYIDDFTETANNSTDIHNDDYSTGNDAELSVISHSTQSFWSGILRSPELYQNSPFQQILHSLVKIESEKLLKVGYPSKNDSAACEYSRLEFDSDEDFDAAFPKFRAEVCENLRLITKLYPKITFSYGNTLLRALMNDVQMFDGVTDSPIDRHVSWEAIIYLMDAIGSILLKNSQVEDVKLLAKEGLDLLHLCLNFNTEDPVISSSMLSCISALFFFLEFSSELLLTVFEKVFSVWTCYTTDGRNQAYIKEIQNIRRHAGALFIKLCLSCPKIIMPAFELLSQHIQDFIQHSPNLSQIEKSSLFEGLIILSNEICDYDKQRNFLQTLLSPVISLWLSNNIQKHISTPENFILGIGLDQASENYQNMENKIRSDVMLCLNVIKACVKRCKLPSDLEAAKKGNFIHPLSQSLNITLYQNPSAVQILPTIPGIFAFIKTLDSLNDPNMQSKIHPSFSGVMEMTETDKNAILGIPNIENSQQPRTPFERMKTHLQTLYENCIQILGCSVENLFIDFYTIQSLPCLLTDNMFCNIHNLTDYKLRQLIRIFLKPFFLQCPPTAYDMLVNVIFGFSQFMRQKLTIRWQNFKKRYGSCAEYEQQESEIQEVLEDQSNRLLTREYINFLGALLTYKGTNLDVSDVGMEDDRNENSQPKCMSELGIKLLQCENTRSIIICTFFDALSWLDTVANLKCISFCELIVKQLFKEDMIKSMQEANYLMLNVIQSLQDLGEHEYNLGQLISLGVLLYENLRTKFPELRETILLYTSCDPHSIKVRVFFTRNLVSSFQIIKIYSK
ncbi:exportin-5-like [Uloborus diversus]|uniref:exportin-5-like n=1 Tax=Uloborus diversus TaxID=327109 RepID=UPI0024098A5F|nr:exportin-5-like [Uloborus diversus]